MWTRSWEVFEMRFHSDVEPYRILNTAYASRAGDDYGAFVIPGPCGMDLKIIASPGNAHDSIPWEHVSVSTPRRCPNWTEMCFVKELFWAEDEVVMQLHPAKSNYVNVHNFCLHLWKPTNAEIPLPPTIAV
jgi:hypothetical protein